MGRRLVVATAIIVGGLIAAILAVEGTGDVGLNAALRATAKTSLFLFLLAFLASSINSLWRGRVGKWLMRHRRHLGLSFAVSHWLHFALIAARMVSPSSVFWEQRSVASLAGGFVAYLFLLAMTITSFDGPTNWLGRKKWKILHKTGVYVIWAVFAVAYTGTVRTELDSALLVGLLVLALGVRAAARMRQLRKKRK